MSDNAPGAGHNNPPKEPFEVAEEEITGLYNEALLWLDGEPITTKELADGIDKLKTMINDAIKRADEARKAENKPFDDGKSAVQEKYNTLIGQTKSVTGIAVMALDACKKALTPWLLAEQKRKDEEAAEALRIAKEKEDALRDQQSLSDQSNLAEQQRLSDLADEAQKASRIAASKEKQSVTKTGLRTTYSGEITSLKDLASHVYRNDPDGMMALLQQWVDKTVSGHGFGAVSLSIPGVNIIEHKEAK